MPRQLKTPANTDRQKARAVLSVPTSKSPQRECFELAFGDQHESIHVAQRSLGPWWQIEHVSSSRRTEILLPHLHLAGRVEFEVGVVAPEPVFANARAARREVGDGDAGVIPSSSADQLRSGEGVDSAQTRGHDDMPVQPSDFECRQIGGRQLFADDTSQNLRFFGYGIWT